jgi:DNA polymerase-3 subunit delta'
MMIGHSWARELLDRAAARGRLSHAYLFSGPTSVGKTALAMYLGSVLVCADPAHAPCRICRGCRLVARGGHPDVQVVTRTEDRRNLTVDQVRAIEDSIGLAPFEARQKLICLDGADLLNDAAASALLKTLEEPPAHAMLVLCAADPLALPSTIRSRCQHLALQPVPAATIAAALTSQYAVEPARAAELAGLARGRPGWAIRALEQPSLVEEAVSTQTLIAGLAAAGPFSRLMAVNSWLGGGKESTFNQSRDRALVFLALLEGWWRDALLLSQEVQAPSIRAQLLGSAEATGLAPATIVAFLVRIQQAAARVEANTAPRLVLEQLVGVMPTCGLHAPQC